jgi:hypothetical protein
MKNLKTEYNFEEDDNYNNKNKFIYLGVQTTEVNHYKSQSTTFDIFLDYTFKQKRYIISKNKNKARLSNYIYELEQTISLNLDLLLSLFSKSNMQNKKILITNDNKSKDTDISSNTNTNTTPESITILIKNIIEKFKKKAEIKKCKNNLISELNSKNEYNLTYYKKIRDLKKQYNQNINKTNNSLDSIDINE